MTTKGSKLSIEDLPAAGDGRWWKIELKGPAAKPIKVTLMQSMVTGRKGLSTALNFEQTIAVKDKIIEAADLILVRVSDYENVVGNFGEPTEGGAL